MRSGAIGFAGGVVCIALAVEAASRTVAARLARRVVSLVRIGCMEEGPFST
jgi:short subunit dehydrogenase-like uncharacterized protein